MSIGCPKGRKGTVTRRMQIDQRERVPKVAGMERYIGQTRPVLGELVPVEEG
jgi:hypothetical protein